MKLSDHKTSYQPNKPFVLMLFLWAGALFGIGGPQLLAAQATHLSYEIVGGKTVPLHQVEPVYPIRAFNRKIEGWVQVKFTITPAGSVDMDSIEVTDAQPRGMFDTSAMQAIAQFTFEPRIQDGVAVELPNVQHVFRYNLSEIDE